MIDPLNIGLIVLFLAWGALCFWVGRKPQQAKAVAIEAEAKFRDIVADLQAKLKEVTEKNTPAPIAASTGLAAHLSPGTTPLDSYADVTDMAMSIGAIGYPGQVELDGKIVKSGTSPGVKYMTTGTGVVKVS
jgi:hypothetical protein